MKSPWLVDHKSGAVLKHCSNTRRIRTRVKYHCEYIGFGADHAATGYQLRLARSVRVYERCLSIEPLMWSTSQGDFIYRIAFHYTAHFVLLFVGKVALEHCFSTNQMSRKSEHQKYRRYKNGLSSLNT